MGEGGSNKAKCCAGATSRLGTSHLLVLLVIVVLSVGATCLSFDYSSVNCIIPSVGKAVYLTCQKLNQSVSGVDSCSMSTFVTATWHEELYNAVINKVQHLRLGIASFCGVYLQFLDGFPLLTKSITAGIVGGIGDGLAQTFEMMLCSTRQRFDVRRALCVATEGLLVSGPLMHFFYHYLDLLIPVDSVDSSATQKWAVSILQVSIDCLVMDFIFVATLMITTAILEGKARNIRKELKEEYFKGVKAAWMSSMLIAPLQCCLFRYVPIAFRVLAMNFQDIIWNAAISYVAHRTRRAGDTKKTKDL
mmetsp:Transcript_6266/g.10887  ORF Transcript_6266/g.10887 Transcript_6266/m.10887 type:complete len:305 (+) Transcript_6266:57-971(+)